jgi:LPS export ABC transporter permease LptF/LPS export ABC transporter permease LptG
VRIFTRYVLKEVLWHGLLGASVLTFIIFIRSLTQILEMVVRNSAPVPSIAQLFFLILPKAFKVTIPIGVLVGILIALSRMAADSEVTAMRAAGVSVRTFLKIVAIFGLAAWLLALGNTTIVEPLSAAALARLEKSMAASQISFEVQPRVFYEEFKDHVLYVEDVTTVSGAVLWKNVFLADVSSPESPTLIVAKEGTPTSIGPNTIRLHLNDGEIHEPASQGQEPTTKASNQYNVSTFKQFDRDLTWPPRAQPAGDAVPLAQLGTLEVLRLSNSASNKDLARAYRIDFHRRLALPTACLVLVLIGIPLGLSAKKGGRGAGFVLSIILVFVYYFLSIIGVAMARGGRVAPSLGVWMANIVFAVVGLLLLWRTDKLPIEIGLGQVFLASMKGWTRSWIKEREERSPALAGRRGFGTRLTIALVAFLGIAVLLLALSGPLSRLIGRVPSAVWGEEYFYALVSLFILGVIVLLAQRFLLILDNYVLKTFARFLALIMSSLVVVSLIFTFFELLGDIARNKIPLVTVGEYLLNEVPSLLYMPVVPLSVLLAVLIAFGLLHKSSEITAMKATGVSVYRTVIPILGIAMALASGLFLLDQWYLPTANKRAETLRNTIKGRPPQTYLRPARWIFGQSGNHGSAGDRDAPWKVYYYKFYDPDRDQFGSISTFELDPHSFQITKRVYAVRAHWEEGLQKWVFEKGWQRSFNDDTVSDFRQFDVSTFPELDEVPSYFKKEVRQSSEMNYEELRNYIRDLQQSGFDVVRLRVQLQKKIAFPLITLVMAILAVPFALSGGRRGALSGVALALLIAIVYQLTAGLFEAMGNVSQLPPLVAAWMPDLIFGLAGGYMILKTPS